MTQTNRVTKRILENLYKMYQVNEREGRDT